MIKIVNYGMGNTASILNIIIKVGGRAQVCDDPSQLEGGAAVILPGVGSFDNGVSRLKEAGFWKALETLVHRDRVPILGVCLGMQLFFSESEEGEQSGLGWLDGDVVKFNRSVSSVGDKLRVPHMGWNSIRSRTPCKFFNWAGEDRFYFVHSYHVRCRNEEDVWATTEYGYTFPSAVRKGNIFGVQFHPEKSHRYGYKFFSDFLSLVHDE